MARHKRFTFRGPHPTKRYSYGPAAGQPYQSHADVLVVVGEESIAISMNGTAVMSPREFREWCKSILRAGES